jgi:hypothetical protein
MDTSTIGKRAWSYADVLVNDVFVTQNSSNVTIEDPREVCSYIA